MKHENVHPVIRSDQDVIEYYRQRADRFGNEAEMVGRHDRMLVWARGVSFLAFGGCMLMALLDEPVRSLWSTIGLVMLVCLLVLAGWDESRKRRQQRLREMRKINEWQLARKQRRWEDVPVPHFAVPHQHAAVAKDLDLFGQASLFQLICLANTPRGIETLANWIVQPSGIDEIQQRQQSVKELVGACELREELVLRNHLLSQGLASPNSFQRWVEGPSLLALKPWLKWIARSSPLLMLLALVLLATGWFPAAVGATAIVSLLCLNVLLSIVFSGRIHDLFDSISTRDGELSHYVALFELMNRMPHESTKLSDLHDMVVRQDGGALRHLRRLHRIMRWAGARHDPVLGLFYFGLQAIFLWDFHVLDLLERWQKRCRHLVGGWFDALGELESLFSLACLAHDQPLWQFPQIADNGSTELSAMGLGHPLLADQQRVVNDVRIGPAGTVLLVTGSNMSGKSTLLRAIGVNGMLAEAGGPVCARQLVLPSLVVTTSMRIQDSLEDGVSFFMAELKRLKTIVDQAAALNEGHGRVLLYLLDEILQGTNSVERHLAVSQVLSHLIGQGAIGAVSTHDLELAQAPELQGYCQTVHFRETLHGDGVSGQQMTFDYRLRDGVATTRNAMKLLELVGLLPTEEESDPIGR